MGAAAFGLLRKQGVAVQTSQLPEAEVHSEWFGRIYESAMGTTAVPNDGLNVSGLEETERGLFPFEKRKYPQEARVIVSMVG